MAIYTTKMHTVDAMQYDGTNYKEIEHWIGSGNVNFIEPEDRDDDPDAEMELLSSAHSNWVPIHKGDWIVINNGKFMRVNDQTFRENYEEEK